jgi:hypothetical protein
MKTLFALSLLSLAGCANPQAEADRWQDYQTDLAVAKAFHRYTCGACLPRHRSLEGFSKENTPRRVSVTRPVAVPSSSPNPAQAPQDSLQVKREIYDLSQKIAVLEEALKTNATTTNSNEQLIVQQIVGLKNQLAQLQTAAPVAVVTPQPQTPSGRRIPGN